MATVSSVSVSSAPARVSARPSAWPVFEHRLVAYRRVWRGSVFSTFLLPVLFLLGLGVSVGRYVNAGGHLATPYVDFIAPGLLVSTSLQIAIGESAWPVLGAFQWNRIYHAMRATPLRAADLVTGEIMFVLLRVGLAAVGFLVVMVGFGAVHSWWAPAVVPIALLVGAASCAPVLAFSASISTDNMFALLFRFGVIPMTLFAGVFFPVSALPVVARALAYVSPLWHGVELSRAASLGTGLSGPAIVGHVGYLAAWAAVGYALARSRYARKLAD
jgi:lipooligosaccharide transport system permease protein